MNIRSITFDEKKNTVTLSGPFDPHKLSKELWCKACDVIIEIIINPPPPPPPSPPPPPPPKVCCCKWPCPCYHDNYGALRCCFCCLVYVCPHPPPPPPPPPQSCSCCQGNYGCPRCCSCGVVTVCKDAPCTAYDGYTNCIIM